MLTDDGELASQVRSLRVHGAAEEGGFAEAGLNSRLDAVQAAVLEAKLGWVGEHDARREDQLARYRRLWAEAELSETVRLPEPFAEGDVVHQLTVQVRRSWRKGSPRRRRKGLASEFSCSMHPGLPPVNGSPLHRRG